MMLRIEINEIVEKGHSIDKESEWLKCRTTSGKTVVFWGELGYPNRNIISIYNQKLPVQVELLEPELCIPTEWEKTKWNLAYSVSSESEIVICPDS